MRQVSDEFLLHVAEYSATMIGLFLVGVFFYAQTGLHRLSPAGRQIFEPYLRAGVRIVLVVFAIPLILALTLVVLEPVWSRVVFAVLCVLLILTNIDSAIRVRGVSTATGSRSLLVHEIIGTISVPVIVITPWALGGLSPTREDLTWAILISFVVGLLSLGTTVLSIFDIGRRQTANGAGDEDQRVEPAADPAEQPAADPAEQPAA
ncbi:MAG: hypothetical protein ACRDT2_12470, partial [Natronosporangium sp.]